MLGTFDVFALGTLLFVVLLLLLAGGVWIAICLFIVGWLGLELIGGVPAGSVLATTVWGGSGSWELAALPLFIWMGEILFRTRLSDQMFNGLAPWMNHIPGRLLHINVFASGLFGSVSGSSSATTATVAKIALPELKKRGYDDNLSLGSLAGAGTLGILIPPSIIMIVYGIAANVSIIQVFLAGFIPALIIMVFYSGYIAVWAILNTEKMPPAEPSTTIREKLSASLGLVPIVMLMIFIFLMLVKGWATVTECAAWGVAGSLLIGLWNKSLTWKIFWEAVVGSIRVTCMIMFIVASASFMKQALAYAGIPMALAEWVNSLQLSPYELIAILVVMFILLGMVLDGVSMILLTTSVIMPMITMAGFDLIWFGIFMVILVEMATVTPPVGFNLFILTAMSGKSLYTVSRAAFPFFVLLIASVAIITVFPDLVMWLPNRLSR